MNRKTEMFNLGGRIAATAFIGETVNLGAPVDIADNVTIYNSSSVGSFTYVNVGSVIYGLVEIGKFCSIGRSVEIGLASHPVNFLSTHPFQVASSLFVRIPAYAGISRKAWRFHKKTIVGNDVWIGAKASVNTGISIGHGAIVAAGAVVTKDVPPYAIVGGVSARIIGFRFSDEVIKSLLEVEWWEKPLEILSSLPFDDIERCISILQKIHNEVLK